MKIKEFTHDEKLVCIGQLMLDLRGNWGWDYGPRLDSLIELIDLTDDSKLESVKHDALYERDEAEYRDGRIFRGEYMYAHLSEEGNTLRVRDYLNEILSHPEYSPALSE